MPTTARILADSVSPSGARITTMILTYPRIIHAEVLRHRAFSHSVGSSRAIPVARQREAIANDPFIPSEWGANQRGMVAGDALDPEASEQARAIWLAALADMQRHTQALEALKVHKQLTNRLLETFSYVTDVVTATDWQNLFVQRLHPDAQPQIREAVERCYEEYMRSQPRVLDIGDWHLPFADDEHSQSLPLDVRRRVSAARCARTSYLTHDGRYSVEDDLELYTRLEVGGAIGHMSPMEHQATPFTQPYWQSRNFRGWHQWREIIERATNRSTPALSLTKDFAPS